MTTLSKPDRLRLTAQPMQCLLRMAAHQTPSLCDENAETTCVFAMAADAEHLERDLSNLFVRLLCMSRAALRAFVQLVQGVDCALEFDRVCTQFRFSSRTRVRFTNPELLCLFVSITHPSVDRLTFFDSHFFRRNLLRIGKCMVDDGALHANTRVHFHRTTNDSAYGSLLEAIRPHIRHVVLDDEFARYGQSHALYDTLTVQTENKAELHYPSSFIGTRCRCARVEEVLSVRALVEFRDFPPNDSVAELHVGMNEEPVEQHEQAVRRIQHTFPHLGHLCLVKRRQFKLPNPNDPRNLVPKLDEFDQLVRQLAPIYAARTDFTTDFSFKCAVVLPDTDLDILPDLGPVLEPHGFTKTSQSQDHDMYELTQPNDAGGHTYYKMLLNGRALLQLVSDKEYDRKISGPLEVLQDEKWRSVFAVMTANLLYLFETEDVHMQAPLMLLIIEDCLVEMADDNLTGKPFSFMLRSRTTKRVFTFAAPDFKSLERWIHYLTVSSIDYIQATTQTVLATLSQRNSPDQPAIQQDKPVERQSKT